MLISDTTLALIRRALAIWKEHFGRRLEFFAENSQLDQLSSSEADQVVLALELARLAEEAAALCTFTANDLITKPDEVTTKINLLKEIQAAAKSQEIQALLQDCRATVQATATIFGAWDKVAPLVGTTQLGMFLRTAEREFKSLTVHQYAQGKNKRDAFHLNGWIYAFPSMHELVCALAKQPVDGLTLCTVVDPDIPEYSVFAWAVKTGSTLTVLSQNNGLSHQGQKFIRRNPGRDFARRAEGCFYPYSIFEYKETATASGSGSQVRIAGMFKAGQAPQTEEITIHDVAMHQVRPIKDLEAAEVLWLILIAQLIHRQYWVAEQKTAELAYTGEMVENPEIVPQLLTTQASGTLLLPAPTTGQVIVPSNPYQPISLIKLDAPTIKAVGEDGSNWEGPRDVGGRTGRNDWMVERYSSRVNHEALSQLPKQMLALPCSEHPSDNEFFAKCKRRSEGEPEMPLHPVVPLTTDGAVTSHSTFLKPDRGYSNAPERYTITPFTPARLYGTKAEIEQERFFIVRSNQGEAIQALADQEFVSRAQEIITWFQQAALRNLPALKLAIGKEKLEIVHQARDPAGTSFTNATRETTTNILKLWRIRDEEEPHYSWGLCQILASFHSGIQKKSNWGYKCVEDSQHFGQCKAIFSPPDATGLAAMLGMTVAELPDVLQHWQSEQSQNTYIGNPILNRVDPVERLTNPWTRLHFRIQLNFNRKTFKRWAKGVVRDQPELKVTSYPEYTTDRLLNFA